MMEMSEDQEKVVVKLIEERWTYGRQRYNRMFMAYGPGRMWDEFKNEGEGKQIIAIDQLLSPLIGKEPLKGNDQSE